MLGNREWNSKVRFWPVRDRRQRGIRLHSSSELRAYDHHQRTQVDFTKGQREDIQLGRLAMYGDGMETLLA